MIAAKVEDASSKSTVAHGLRAVRYCDKQSLATIGRLHMELLHFGPMAHLGELFIREICYGIHLREGVLEATLYEVLGEPAGFVAYTPRSITFHRQGLGKH